MRLMLADGYDAMGIDVSPEQVAIARAAGLDVYRRVTTTRFWRSVPDGSQRSWPPIWWST